MNDVWSAVRIKDVGVVDAVHVSSNGVNEPVGLSSNGFMVCRTDEITTNLYLQILLFLNDFIQGCLECEN